MKLAVARWIVGAETPWSWRCCGVPRRAGYRVALAAAAAGETELVVLDKRPSPREHHQVLAVGAARCRHENSHVAVAGCLWAPSGGGRWVRACGRMSGSLPVRHFLLLLLWLASRALAPAGHCVSALLHLFRIKSVCRCSRLPLLAHNAACGVSVSGGSEISVAPIGAPARLIFSSPRFASSEFPRRVPRAADRADWSK